MNSDNNSNSSDTSSTHKQRSPSIYPPTSAIVDPTPQELSPTALKNLAAKINPPFSTASSSMDKEKCEKKLLWYNFESMNKDSEENVSDVEGDALEDYRYKTFLEFEEEYKTNLLETETKNQRFENVIKFSWKIEDFKAFATKVYALRPGYANALGEPVDQLKSPMFSFERETVFKNIGYNDPSNNLSTKVSRGPLTWCVLLKLPTRFEQTESVGIFLKLAGMDKLNLPEQFSFSCRIDFLVLNEKEECLKYKHCENEFDIQYTDWGLSSFFSLADQSVLDSNGALNVFVRVRQKYNVPHKSLYDSKKATNKIGIKNLGATCYLNSLLQTLFYTKRLRLAVYNLQTTYYRPINETNGESKQSSELKLSKDRFVESLQKLFFELETSDRPVDTKKLTKSFGWNNFELFLQHDVQELNRQLCDKLQSRFSTEDDVVRDLFRGQYKSFIKCVNIDYESSKIEEYYDLQLDVKGLKDVYESLDKFIEVEKLEGENQYLCEDPENNYKGKQDAEKGIKFISFPHVLHLHLKRFNYNFQKDKTEKINDKYEFPLILDLDKYIPTPEREGNNRFILHSVLVHSGSVNSGHYYSYINSFDHFDPENPQAPEKCVSWYKFDDEQVVRVKQRRAINATFGGPLRKSAPIIANPEADINHMNGVRLPIKELQKVTSAYMLVYFRIDSLPSLLPRKRVTDPCYETLLQNLRLEIKQEEEQKLLKQQVRQQIRIRVIKDSELFDFVESGKFVSEATIYTEDVRPRQVCTKTIDFVNQTIDGGDFLVLSKSDSTTVLYDLIARKVKCKPEDFRLWYVDYRDNKTFRVSSVIPRVKQKERVGTEMMEQFVSRGNKVLLSEVFSVDQWSFHNPGCVFFEVRKDGISNSSRKNGRKRKFSGSKSPVPFATDYSSDSSSNSFETSASKQSHMSQSSSDIIRLDDIEEIQNNDELVLLFLRVYDRRTEPAKLHHVGSIVVNNSGLRNEFTMRVAKRFPNFSFISEASHICDMIDPRSVRRYEINDKSLSELELVVGDLLCFEVGSEGPTLEEYINQKVTEVRLNLISTGTIRARNLRVQISANLQMPYTILARSLAATLQQLPEPVFIDKERILFYARNAGQPCLEPLKYLYQFLKPTDEEASEKVWNLYFDVAPFEVKKITTHSLVKISLYNKLEKFGTEIRVLPNTTPVDQVVEILLEPTRFSKGSLIRIEKNYTPNISTKIQSSEERMTAAHLSSLRVTLPEYMIDNDDTSVESEVAPGDGGMSLEYEYCLLCKDRELTLPIKKDIKNIFKSFEFPVDAMCKPESIVESFVFVGFFEADGIKLNVHPLLLPVTPDNTTDYLKENWLKNLFGSVDDKEWSFAFVAPGLSRFIQVEESKDSNKALSNKFIFPAHENETLRRTTCAFALVTEKFVLSRMQLLDAEFEKYTIVTS
eukprot:augustus_masked-scaffold_56-processed-gene-1.89-mRNA-1 protein AED:0.38 eAED:0.40 QI:0/-1/0/1/-1/1/1/0/1414